MLCCPLQKLPANKSPYSLPLRPKLRLVSLFNDAFPERTTSLGSTGSSIKAPRQRANLRFWNVEMGKSNHLLFLHLTAPASAKLNICFSPGSPLSKGTFDAVSQRFASFFFVDQNGSTPAEKNHEKDRLIALALVPTTPKVNLITNVLKKMHENGRKVL